MFHPPVDNLLQVFARQMDIRFNLRLVSDSPALFIAKSTGCFWRMTELSLYLLLWRFLSLQTCLVVFGFVPCDQNRLPVKHTFFSAGHNSIMGKCFVSSVCAYSGAWVHAETDIDQRVFIEEKVDGSVFDIFTWGFHRLGNHRILFSTLVLES